jgi:hypothetical protein
MAINEKNPPVINTNPLFGVDAELQSLAVQLSTIPWLEKSWSRAKMLNAKKVDGKINNEPMIYISEKEYYSTLPNDSFKAFSFWGVVSPQTGQDAINAVVSEQSFEARVYQIVWCDLQKIDRTKDFIFTQELITDVLIVLNRNSVFTLERVIDERVEDIYKGFTLQPEHRDLLMYPYQAFRIEGRLNYSIKLC